MRKSIEFWPDLPTKFESIVAEVERVYNPPVITYSLVHLSQGAKEYKNLESIMEISRYGSLGKLLRVTGLVMKFVSLLKSKTTVESKELNAVDLKRAEGAWVRSIQVDSFPNEYGKLVSENNLVYKSQLILFLDEDKLIRCRGRLNEDKLPLEMKNPLLLPTRHPFTDLVINERHQRVHHNGVQETLASIREEFWILKGCEAVQKVLRKCVICKRYEGKPYSTPLIPDLPEERVSDDPPFTHTGIDFAGPLYAKTRSAGEDKVAKCYVCVFTCASTRALHLEVTKDMSVATFLQAFRRFCGRRGLPSTLMTDNAKTFKASAAEVKKVVHSEEIHRYLTNRKVTWQFIVEKAPWWGGYWERMVGIVKRCLKKTIGRCTLTIEELSTVMIEIESTLNNRPLTYLYSDDEGVSQVLTPAHLIYGRRLTTNPSSRQFEVMSTAKTLTRRVKYQFQLLSNFARQWQREYLLSLRERTINKSRGQQTQQIKVGDIVVLKEDCTSRCMWKLAKVLELLKGRDEMIRAAKVQLLSKDKITSIRRPIQHLIPLEVNN